MHTMQVQQNTMAQVVQSQPQPNAQSNDALLRVSALLVHAHWWPGLNVNGFSSVPRLAKEESEWQAFH